MTEPPSAQPRPSPQEIEATLLRMLEACGPDRSISAMDVARALGGDHPDGWGPLTQPVRKVAVALAKAGQATILRKGKPVDPADFRGVYRIAPPRGAPQPD